MLIFPTFTASNFYFFQFFFSQLLIIFTFARKCGRPIGREKGNGCESRAVPLLYTFIYLLKSVRWSRGAKVDFIVKNFRLLRTERRRNATMLDREPTREGF
jgi:CBS domain containing-hemolysin-like protein